MEHRYGAYGRSTALGTGGIKKTHTPNIVCLLKFYNRDNMCCYTQFYGNLLSFVRKLRLKKKFAYTSGSQLGVIMPPPPGGERFNVWRHFLVVMTREEGVLQASNR